MNLLPSRKVLGGAPANFAYAANLLGSEGIVASRVGDDVPGREVYSCMQTLGLNTAYTQCDDLHETGTAKVLIDASGQPTFFIKEYVSWDYLQWTKAWQELSARADVVCFGSLAQRSEKSAATIESFLTSASSKTLRIFDANLRQSFYNEDVLRRSLQWGHIAKLNEHELRHISALFELGPGDDETLARRMLQVWDLRLVCVTRGAHGSLLVSKDETVEHAGFRTKIVDAVGAGDVFTACLAHYYWAGRSLKEISEAANRLASWATTQAGATPLVSKSEVQNILRRTVLE